MCEAGRQGARGQDADTRTDSLPLGKRQVQPKVGRWWEGILIDHSVYRVRTKWDTKPEILS